MSAEQLITKHLDIWTSAHKTRSSAGRGSSNKLDLYGIKKLRELILELAVRGKLVPQDPNDEPASELLRKIALEKSSLIYEGKIKKDKSLPPIKDSERPFILPAGWSFARLSELALSQAGFAFKSNCFNEKAIGLPLIRIRDVGQEFSGTYYDGEFREEFIVNNGDYLISMDGNFRVAEWQYGRALLNQRVSRLIFFGKMVQQKFIAESLQARLVSLQGVKAYTTVDHLSGGQISNAVIGVPPLTEQYRIVAKIDELMAFCDELEQAQTDNIAAHAQLVQALLTTLTNSKDHQELQANWQRIAEHFDTLFTTEDSIDQLKQTILQLAVMGKLSSHSKQDTDIEKLLEDVLLSKRKLNINSKELSFLESELKSALGKCVNNRVMLKTRFFCDFITKGTTPEKNELLDAGDIPFLKVYNIVNNSLDFKYKPSFVSREVHSSKLSRSRIYPNDVIMNIVGPPLGKVAIVNNDYPEWNMNQALAVFRPLAGISYRYLFYMLSSHSILYSVLTEVKGSAGQDNLSLEQCRDLLIPIPSVEEQLRIVNKLDDLYSICDNLKERLCGLKNVGVSLSESLVENILA